jgi:hypothetical protein
MNGRPLPLLLWLSVASFLGCANVKVHKVPVADRIAGNDENITGFRYYLNRPYLTVSRKVPVSVTYVPVSLAAYPADPAKPFPTDYDIVLVSQLPGPDGKFPVFDRTGNPRPDINASKDVKLIPVSTTGGGDRTTLTVEKVLNTVYLALFTELQKYCEAKSIKFPEVTTLDKLKEFILDKDSLKTDLGQKSDKLVDHAVDRGIQGLTGILKDAEITGFKKDKRDTIIDVAKKNLGLSGKGDTPATQKGFAGLSFTAADQGDSTKNPPAAPAPAAPDVFQVAFLPDFEEQYAIHNCNFLAVTKYKYTFCNGTELVSMAGSYDSTDVPVKIIETVGKLVEAAGAIAKAKLGGAAKSELGYAEGGATARFWIRTEQSIEPGIYRIQKSWERAAAVTAAPVHPEQVPGLFSDVGLPLVTSVSVIGKDQHDKEVENLYK